MNYYLRERLQGNVDELLGCVTALTEGADRADELVHIRQIAHRLADSEEVFGYGPIRANAMALETLVIAEAVNADVCGAIDTLVAQCCPMLEGATGPVRPASGANCWSSLGGPKLLVARGCTNRALAKGPDDS